MPAHNAKAKLIRENAYKIVSKREIAKIFRQLNRSIDAQSYNKIATCGARISTRIVANRPELIAAIVTGESAYKNDAGIDIHWLLVNLLRTLNPDHIIKTGATMKKVVIKTGTFPKNSSEAIATIAIHGGVADDEPIPTWCHDSKQVWNKSLAPAGVVGRAPPTNEPNRFLELTKETTAIARKPKTSGRLKIDNH